MKSRRGGFPMKVQFNNDFLAMAIIIGLTVLFANYRLAAAYMAILKAWKGLH
jgi:hypothetical protein